VTVGVDSELDPTAGDIAPEHLILLGWDCYGVRSVIAVVLILYGGVCGLVFSGFVDPDLQPGVLILVIIARVKGDAHLFEYSVRIWHVFSPEVLRHRFAA